MSRSVEKDLFKLYFSDILFKKIVKLYFNNNNNYNIGI